MSFSSRLRLSHQSKNFFTARAYAMRVLRLRMLAVKNSMKRRLVRSLFAEHSFRGLLHLYKGAMCFNATVGVLSLR
jgi:hypothetical protein